MLRTSINKQMYKILQSGNKRLKTILHQYRILFNLYSHFKC